MSLVVDGTGKIVMQAGGMLSTGGGGGGSATVQHGQTFTIVGTGFGTKSNALTPLVFDDGSDAAWGSTSAQFNATGSKFPGAAGGNFNIQNQPPGFSPVGTFIPMLNKFGKSVTSGACAFSGTNDSNGVYLGCYFVPPNNGTNVTWPFSCRWEFDFCYDAGFYHDPQSDNNTKMGNAGESKSVWGNPPNLYLYYDPYPIGQFSIIGYTRANPCVITIGTKQAGNPFQNGTVPAFFGVSLGSSHPLNGFFANGGLTVGGSNGAFTLTLTGVDSTGWPAYPAVIPISNMTNASPCVVTSTATVNPFWSGQTITPDGVTGIDNTAGGYPVNRIPFVVDVVGGSAGAWTASLLISGFGTAFDTSNTAHYPAYTGCTNGLYTGGASTPYSAAQATYTGAVNPIVQLEGSGATIGFANPFPSPWSPTSGINGTPWHRMKVEYTYDQTVSTSGSVGSLRILIDNTVLFNFQNQRTDALAAAASTTLSRFMPYGLVYQRDRGPNNFVYLQGGYYDYGGTTGQTAVVYASDQSTWGVVGGIYEPQPNLTAWSNTSISGTFYQGKIPNSNGSSIYFYVCPENVTAGTAPVTPSNIPTLTASNLPSITTASLPGATHSVAYNSGSITVSGGTAPYTFTLASTSTGTAGIVSNAWSYSSASNNTWAVNSSTGAVTGTPTTVETDLIVIYVKDANGFGDAKQLSIVVS